MTHRPDRRARTARWSPTARASVGFLREGERVVGVRVRDLENGRGARGPGASRSSTRPACGPTRPRRWSASAGSSRCGRPRASTSWCRATGSSRSTGLILRTETSVLFVIPWGRHWIIGTTDTDWRLDKAHPAASSRGHRLPALASQRVLAQAAHPRGRRGRVRRAAARCSPARASRPRKLSREHVVGAPRARARRRRRRQVHDLPGHGLGRRRRGGPRPGRPGARRAAPTTSRCSGPRATGRAWNSRARTAARSGLHVARIEHLLRRYGSLTDEVLELVEEDPELGAPMPGAEDYLAAEIVYACSHEGPATWTTCWPGGPGSRSSPGTAGVAAAPDAARLMAGVLGWRRSSRAGGRALPRPGRGGAGRRSSPTTRGRRRPARRSRDRAAGVSVRPSAETPRRRHAGAVTETGIVGRDGAVKEITGPAEG